VASSILIGLIDLFFKGM